MRVQIEDEQITFIGTVDEDYLGGSRAAYYRITDTDDKIITADDVAETFPYTLCQHSYDCCARWYYSTGKIVGRMGGHTIVVHESIQNV